MLLGERMMKLYTYGHQPGENGTVNQLPLGGRCQVGGRQIMYN
jgi:hypothetical protein